MILHSSIYLSHNLPNQFSEPIHGNLRVGRWTVIGDSRNSPCPSHGLIGAYNEDGEASVVQLHFVVVVGQEGVASDGLTMYRDKRAFFIQNILFYILFEGGGGTADSQLNIIRSSSQTSSPNECK